jgi:hypothetical protein
LLGLAEVVDWGLAFAAIDDFSLPYVFAFCTSAIVANLRNKGPYALADWNGTVKDLKGNLCPIIKTK